MISGKEVCHTMNDQIDAFLKESSIVSFLSGEEHREPLLWFGYHGAQGIDVGFRTVPLVCCDVLFSLTGLNTGCRKKS